MGLHIIAEFLGVERDKISKTGQVRQIVEEAVKGSGLNVIRSAYHQFKPHGVTCFYLLKESHLAIHTWPEVDYAAIDIFTCDKDGKAKKALELLRKGFAPRKIKIRMLKELQYEKLLRRAKNNQRTY
jgi:S-adenosylmethionine decarboxylase proenzyme